jgi:hypothetical protein
MKLMYGTHDFVILGLTPFPRMSRLELIPKFHIIK